MTSKPIPISGDHTVPRTAASRANSADEGQLAASIAHELNNPLSVLLNLLHLIESEANFTEKGQRYMSLAREELCRISQIAHEAMDRFRDSPSPQKTNVPNLLRNAIEFYKSRFESQGISLATRYCPDGDLVVYAGPLRQVFSNLLLNAADAMPQGGRLHARISAVHDGIEPKRHGLRVTIADTGSGISANELAKIFEPFFTTKGERGSGLGLSLVKDVVQKHSGVLRVRSSTKPKHSGSVFSIFLPAA